MDPDESSARVEDGPQVVEAPSRRAKALRDEIFGSALTLDEAAYILSLDRTTVAKYLREKTLFGFQIGREWLIPEEQLRAYVRRMTESAAHENVEAKRRGILDRMRPGLFGGEKPVKREDLTTLRGRFDKFTKRARRALELAQEEAHGLNHSYIGTEHLLLGLVREGEGVAARVLTGLGVELYRVRSAVEFIIGRGDQEVSGEVGLTPRSKKVIELAVDEARRLGHHYIGTEHLLLGLVREGEGIAAGVLESLNIDLARARAETLRILQQHVRGADEPAVEPPAIPDEAATLVGVEEPALTCPACTARNPVYFRHCFNCGRRLAEG